MNSVFKEYIFQRQLWLVPHLNPNLITFLGIGSILRNIQRTGNDLISKKNTGGQSK